MRGLFLITAALIPLFIFSQKRQGQALIDSLVLQLAAMPDDTNKVRTLSLISYHYSNLNPDKGIEYGYKVLELSEKLKWKNGIALANSEIGINYAAKADYSNALEYDLKALKLYEELKDSNNSGGVLANIGLLYLEQSNYPTALEYFFRALKINEKFNDKNRAALVMENIGTVYFEQKNYTKTTEYYSLALKAYREAGDKTSIARCLGNMARVHSATGNYTLALEHHFMALQANRELESENSIQINLANIGYVFFQMKNYANALKYQLMALDISEKLNNKNSIGINMGNIGETYFAMASDTELTMPREANAKQAIRYLEGAKRILTETNYAAPLAEFTQYLSDAYFLSGDYKSALENHKQYISIKDSIYSQQNRVEIARLETKRALELKDKDIVIKNKQIEIAALEVENKRKERAIFIIGITLLLLGGGFVIIKSLRRVRAQKNALTEIAHIQSHEVRGPVSKMLGLAQLFNHDDPTDPINGEVVKYIATTTQEIDDIIHTVVHKTHRARKAKGS